MIKLIKNNILKDIRISQTETVTIREEHKLFFYYPKRLTSHAYNTHKYMEKEDKIDLTVARKEWIIDV